MNNNRFKIIMLVTVQCVCTITYNFLPINRLNWHLECVWTACFLTNVPVLWTISAGPSSTLAMFYRLCAKICAQLCASFFCRQILGVACAICNIQRRKTNLLKYAEEGRTTSSTTENYWSDGEELGGGRLPPPPYATIFFLLWHAVINFALSTRKRWYGEESFALLKSRTREKEKAARA